MLKPKYLTKKQKSVLEDLFSNRLDLQEVLEKWKVKRQTYYRWHAQEYFAAQFNLRLNLAQREPEVIFARYASNVAERLVGLTVSEKDETARKACMDVITHPDRKAKNKSEKEPKPVEEPIPDLPPEVASRLLAALAGEKLIQKE
jgi:hypothetical protein